MTGSSTTSRGRVWLRRLVAAGALSVALVGAGSTYAALTPSSHAQDSGATSVAIAAGRDLFQQGCSSCHGLNAQGGALAPSLIGVGAAAVDFQVSTGRMPLAQNGPQGPRRQAPVYSQAQIDQMAAYVQSLGGGPRQPTASQLDLTQADLSAGGQLFRTNCAQCHNAAAEGGALTYGKHAVALTPTTSQQMYEAMLTGPSNMPVFADAQLTPQQKLDIVGYIQAIKAQPDPGGHGLGRIGPVPEGLVAWLVGIGLLVGVTLWIGSRA